LRDGDGGPRGRVGSGARGGAGGRDFTAGGGEGLPARTRSRHSRVANDSQLPSIRGTLSDLFEGHVTPSQLTRILGDPALDTGHYDDGHAFGWKVRSHADQHDVWRTLATAAFDGQWDGVVVAIETRAGTDLNGDGVVGPLAGGGPGSGSGGTTSGSTSGSTCAANGASC